MKTRKSQIHQGLSEDYKTKNAALSSFKVFAVILVCVILCHYRTMVRSALMDYLFAMPVESKRNRMNDCVSCFCVQNSHFNLEGLDWGKIVNCTSN